MRNSLVRCASVGIVLSAALLCFDSSSRAEHCWRYVDGVDPVTGQVNFPGFEFTKAPLQCVQQNDQTTSCSWSPGQTCTVGGTCCTSIPEPSSQQSILAMHSEWHTCFGNVGGQRRRFPGRSARWLAFHRQFEFDFDLMREAKLGCGPGRCVMGTCSNNGGITCTTDDQCSAHEGCFIEALDWHQNMSFPYGHFGANYDKLSPAVTHPAGCGTGPNRPDGITCTACRPLPACLYNAGAGPLNGSPATPSDASNCLGFQAETLNTLPNLEAWPRSWIPPTTANFHGEVGAPHGRVVHDRRRMHHARDDRGSALQSHHRRVLPTSPPCNPATGRVLSALRGDLHLQHRRVRAQLLPARSDVLAAAQAAGRHRPRLAGDAPPRPERRRRPLGQHGRDRLVGPHEDPGRDRGAADARRPAPRRAVEPRGRGVVLDRRHAGHAADLGDQRQDRDRSGRHGLEGARRWLHLDRLGPAGRDRPDLPRRLDRSGAVAGQGVLQPQPQSDPGRRRKRTQGRPAADRRAREPPALPAPGERHRSARCAATPAAASRSTSACSARPRSFARSVSARRSRSTATS